MRAIKNIFIILLLLLFSFSLCDAGIPKSWTTLSYDTNHACFYSGIKRVYVPYPGFGSLACLKKSIQMLPDIEKSSYHMAGHAVGLVGASLATCICLVIAAHMGIAPAKNILGPSLTALFVTNPRSFIYQTIGSFDDCK